MVRALLAGTKTQTRRPVKSRTGTFDVCRQASTNQVSDVQATNADGEHVGTIACPYGQPGERLWVRETWGTAVDCIETDSGCFEGDYYTVYRAGGGPAGTPRNGWKPSIHMRRSDSRILLEIVSVRVERLQDISHEDAVAEGIEVVDGTLDDSPVFKNYHPKAFNPVDGFGYPTNSYFSLWDSINGEDSHKANPWVWVVEFKRIDAEGKEVARA